MHPTDLALVTAGRALAHPVRARLLRTLVGRPPLSVTQLVDELSLPQPTVSRHLGELRDAELVVVQREGRQAWYTANGPALRRVAGALGQLATRAAP